MKRSLNLFILVTFLFNMILPYGAQANVLPYMPAAGTMISTTSNYDLPRLVGMKFTSDNPFEFTFILSGGNIDRNETAIRAELAKIHKYFLAALTIPEQDLWVNLSPYEQGRIAPDILAQTELGKDLLGEDYVLKQLAASLTYPESETGKKYWDEINNAVPAGRQVGARSPRPLSGRGNPAPTQTFNKVWIIPGKIKILEAKDRMAIDQATLKVMTDADYLASQNNQNYKLQIANGKLSNGNGNMQSAMCNLQSVNAFKQHILPSIEQEVNQGKHFSQFRQAYSALIMAAWFKNKLKNTILNESFLNKSKIQGADTQDKTIREKIYNEYLKAFQQGAYNIIKTERERPLTPSHAYRQAGLTKRGDEVSALALVKRGPAQPGRVLGNGMRITRRAYFSGGTNAALVTPATLAGVVPVLDQEVDLAFAKIVRPLEEQVVEKPIEVVATHDAAGDGVVEDWVNAAVTAPHKYTLAQIAELHPVAAKYIDEALARIVKAHEDLNPDPTPGVASGRPAGENPAVALSPERVQALLAQAREASDKIGSLSTLLLTGLGANKTIESEIAAADERMVMARATLALGYEPQGELRKNILIAHRNISPRLVTLDLRMQRPDGTFPKEARVLLKDGVPVRFKELSPEDRQLTDQIVEQRISVAMTGVIHGALNGEQAAIGRKLALYGALGSRAAGSSDVSGQANILTGYWTMGFQGKDEDLQRAAIKVVLCGERVPNALSDDKEMLELYQRAAYRVRWVLSRLLLSDQGKNVEKLLLEVPMPKTITGEIASDEHMAVVHRALNLPLAKLIDLMGTGLQISLFERDLSHTLTHMPNELELAFEWNSSIRALGNGAINLTDIESRAWRIWAADPRLDAKGVSYNPEVADLLARIKDYFRWFKQKQDEAGGPDEWFEVAGANLPLASFRGALLEYRLAEALGVTISGLTSAEIKRTELAHRHRLEEKLLVRPDQNGDFKKRHGDTPISAVRETIEILVCGRILSERELIGQLDSRGAIADQANYRQLLENIARRENKWVFSYKQAKDIARKGAAGSSSLGDDSSIKDPAQALKLAQRRFAYLIDNWIPKHKIDDAKKAKLVDILVQHTIRRDEYKSEVVEVLIRMWAASNDVAIKDAATNLDDDEFWLEALVPQLLFFMPTAKKVLANAGVDAEFYSAARQPAAVAQSSDLGGFAMQNVGEQEVDSVQGEVKFSRDKALTQWKDILGVELVTVALKF